MVCSGDASIFRVRILFERPCLVAHVCYCHSTVSCTYTQHLSCSRTCRLWRPILSVTTSVYCKQLSLKLHFHFLQNSWLAVFTSSTSRQSKDRSPQYIIILSPISRAFTILYLKQTMFLECTTMQLLHGYQVRYV